MKNRVMTLILSIRKTQLLRKDRRQKVQRSGVFRYFLTKSKLFVDKNYGDVAYLIKLFFKIIIHDPYTKYGLPDFFYFVSATKHSSVFM